MYETKILKQEYKTVHIIYAYSMSFQQILYLYWIRAVRFIIMNQQILSVLLCLIIKAPALPLS